MNVCLGWKANGVLLQLHLFNVPQEPLALTHAVVSINRMLKENLTKLSKIVRVKLKYSWNETRLSQTRDKIDIKEKIYIRHIDINKTYIRQKKTYTKEHGSWIKPWTKQH